MRKYLRGARAALILTAASASAANAGNFHFASSRTGPGGEALYIDTGSIRTTGDEVSYWDVIVFWRDGHNGTWHPSNTSYTLIHRAIDCKNLRARIETMMSYDMNGTSLATQHGDDQWTDIAPGTDGAGIAEFVCSPSAVASDKGVVTAPDIPTLAAKTRETAISQGWDK